MNEIKTFEDACEKLGISPEEFKITYPDKLGTKFGKSMQAHAKLVIIALALNDGWEPNWGDFSEYKYFPWFDFERNSTADTGFGFSYFVWAYSNSCTFVGARLCFKTSELAKYAGTQFTDLYRDYMV